MNLCFQMFFLTFNQLLQEKTQQDETAYVSVHLHRMSAIHSIFFKTKIKNMKGVRCYECNGKIENFASKSLTVRPWKTQSSFSDVETSKDFAKL